MKIGIIGLGKMGLGSALLLKEKGHEVFAWNRSDDGKAKGIRAGLLICDSIETLSRRLGERAIYWISVSHEGVEEVLSSLDKYLKTGDYIIDAGNSHFKKSIARFETYKKRGINFVDAGVSGGPSGALNGACIMVGGEKEAVEYLRPIFESASVMQGFLYAGKAGAGHFVKMVHNGIEYGMMQAIGEGFEVLKQSDFKLNLTEVANLYQHGSVIESRLVGWLLSGFMRYGEDLDQISPIIKHSGEGMWTVETAKEMKIPTPIIEASLDYRIKSAEDKRYTGRVVSVMRNQFGGHDVSH